MTKLTMNVLLLPFLGIVFGASQTPIDSRVDLHDECPKYVTFCSNPPSDAWENWLLINCKATCADAIDAKNRTVPPAPSVEGRISGTACTGDGTTWEIPEHRCQVCSCVEGTVQCSPPRTRVRKEIHDLTPEEWAKVTRAVNIAHDNGTFQEFAETHANHEIFGVSHGRVSFFLKWHRYFLFEMEYLLQRAIGDCSVTIPYWNSALSREITDSMWTASMLGDGGYKKAPGARTPDRTLILNEPEQFYVRDGPFAWKNMSRREFNGKWITRKGKNFESAIMRAVGVFYPGNQLYTPFDELIIEKRRDFLEFKNGAKDDSRSLNLAHGLGHAYVGGHMNLPSSKIGLSAYDFIFWCHHANVDRLWDLWQTRHNDTKSYDTVMEQRHPSKILLGLPVQNYTAIGGTDVVSEGAEITMESMLTMKGLKLFPEDTVSFDIEYAETEKLQPKKTVVAISQNVGTKQVSRRILSNKKSNFLVKDENENDDEDPAVEEKEPQLRISLKAALCMAETVYDNDREGFRTVSPTCDAREKMQGRLEVLKHMTEMHGQLMENDEEGGNEEEVVLDTEDIDVILEASQELDNLPNTPMKTAQSQVEQVAGFAVDEMSELYLDLLYGNNHVAREDTCLTNACGRICKNTTTTTKKKFGGDCRFYCQCQHEEGNEETLKACKSGHIFSQTREKCVKGNHEKECEDDVAIIADPSLQRRHSSSAQCPKNFFTSSIMPLAFLAY